MINFKNKHILILGMGKSGQSLVHFFKTQQAHCIGFDNYKKGEGNANCQIVNDLSQIDLNQIDVVATSPGISPNHPVYQEAKKLNVPCMSEMEIGLSHLKNKMIAITGTNGKSTLVHLVAHLLNQNNICARAVGNNGIPVTSLIGQIPEDETLIVEVSSYQLDTLKTPYFDLGLIINITEDHISRYETFENYARSKLRLEQVLKKHCPFLISEKTYQTWSKYVTKAPVLFDQKLDKFIKRSDFDQFKIGSVVLENIKAAMAIALEMGLELDQIIPHLPSFQGLEHRCEYVTTLNDVDFYNDSKGTNVEAVIEAIQMMKNPIYLIMGGDDKGLDYSPLKPYFFNKVKEIFFIGEAQEKMAKVFEKDYNICLCNTLEEAVRFAYKRCPKKAAVLLSPGTSSLTMFENFEHRGREFKRIVKQLAGERE